MGSYPTSPRSDFLAWCQAHVEIFSGNSAALGLPADIALAFKNASSMATSASAAQEAAKLSLKSATVTTTEKFSTLRQAASDCVEHIRLFAEQQADPTSVYTLAQIPPPATPSTMPPPGQPTDARVELDPTSGALTIKWKCQNPPGASGTSYIVRRKLPGQSTFEFVGVTGSKKFTDTTLSAGPDSVQYTIQGQRSDRAGPVSSIITINFGLVGQGGNSGLFSVRIGDGGSGGGGARMAA